MVRKLAVSIAVFIVCSLAFLPFSARAGWYSFSSKKDSFIGGLDPDQNWGSSTNLVVGFDSSGYPRRTIVQFDLSSISGSTVSSATLKLNYWYYTPNNPYGRTYWAYRVTQSWTEDGVTWNNPWTTPGGDYTPTGGASATVPSSAGWMIWTVTDIIKAWVEGVEPNYGFLIKDDVESGPYYYLAYFFSREFGFEVLPILEVTYTLPPMASFTESAETVTVGDTISFDASGSSDPDGTIVSYGWDFGDGTTESGMTTTHAYTAAGTYIVTLTVTDNVGVTDTATATKTVEAPPPPPPSAPEFSLPLVAVVSTAAIILFLYKRKLSPTLTH